MSRALVTGSTGFVGSHLVRRLLEEGWEVSAVVREDSSLSALEGVEDRVDVHRHDGTTGAMIEILGAVKPDVTFHLASLFIGEHKEYEVEPLIRSNVLFGAQLLEAMSSAGCRRLVNTGTSWQHYRSRKYSPVCLYAATKQAFEAVLQYYIEVRRIKTVTLKLFDTYGPGDPRAKLFSLLRRASSAKEPLDMSPGQQLLDIVFIDDVVEAYVLAAARLLRGDVQRHETYAVSSGSPLPLREVVAVYERVVGKSLPIRWGARRYRKREVMVPWIKGRPIEGWTPKVGLEEGIRLTEGIELR